MQSPPSTKEMYPHREAGIVLLILGILLLVLAIIVGSICQTVSFPGGAPSSCAYPFAGTAVALGLVGFVLLIVGLILFVSRSPAYMPGTYYGPYWGYPHVAPPAPGPAAIASPMIACRNCGRVYGLNQHPFCPNCGTKLGA